MDLCNFLYETLPTLQRDTVVRRFQEPELGKEITMKTRQGFVSNSSSSSFVVIGNTGKDCSKWLSKVCKPEQYVIGQDGETEFGWSVETHSDVYSRVNFAYLQARDRKLNGNHYMRMLFEAIKDVTGQFPIVSESIQKDGYVDHQSSSSEGQNIEMFEDETILKRFLFDDGSYVETGNDNG
jgi:hypothetical protein